MNIETQLVLEALCQAGVRYAALVVEMHINKPYGLRLLSAKGDLWAVPPELRERAQAVLEQYINFDTISLVGERLDYVGVKKFEINYWIAVADTVNGTIDVNYLMDEPRIEQLPQFVLGRKNVINHLRARQIDKITYRYDSYDGEVVTTLVTGSNYAGNVLPVDARSHSELTNWMHKTLERRYGSVWRDGVEGSGRLVWDINYGTLDIQYSQTLNFKDPEQNVVTKEGYLAAAPEDVKRAWIDFKNRELNAGQSLRINYIIRKGQTPIGSAAILHKEKELALDFDAFTEKDKAWLDHYLLFHVIACEPFAQIEGAREGWVEIDADTETVRVYEAREPYEVESVCEQTAILREQVDDKTLSGREKRRRLGIASVLGRNVADVRKQVTIESQRR